MAKEINASSIRRYNLIAGFFHLAQMFAVLALANDFTLPIVARYMAGPPGSVFADPITLLDAPVGITVSIFLGLSAFFHLLLQVRNSSVAIAQALQLNAITSAGLNTQSLHQ